MPNPYKSDREIDKDRHSTLLTRLSVAQEFDKQSRDRLKKILKVLDGKREVIVGGDTKTVNIKYPLLWIAYDNYLSNLTATEPQVVIQSEGREDAVKQAFWKGVLDYKKRKIRVDDSKDEFVQSFITSGKAVFKAGRDVAVETVEEEVRSGENSETVMKRNVDVVSRNESFIEVVDPRRFWMSPETRYKSPLLGEECPYVIEEMIKSPDYIESKYNVKLDEDELEIIDPNEDVDDGKKTTTMVKDVDDIKRVRFYAYYGVWKLKGKNITNAEVLFTKKRILKESNFDDKYEFKKKPYVVGLNYRKFFTPEALGCLDAALDLDQEYNENMNRIRTYVRRMVNPKWAKVKGTEVDEDALLHPDTGVVVEESQVNAIRPLTPPSIGGDIVNQTKDVETLFQLLTGIIYGSTAVKEAGTATGQSIVEKGADVKFGRMVRVLERCIEERDIMLLQLEQQFAPKEGTDIRITGSEMVQLISNKKKLFKERMRIWETERQMAQNAGQPFDEAPPVDEYEKFQLSDDGRAVITNYSPEDIEGEFELRVISQSSNRLNRAVKSNQYQDALKNSNNDPTIQRPELWRRFFAINNEDNVDDIVNSNPDSMVPNNTALTPGASQGGVLNESNLLGNISNQAEAV